MCQWRQEHRETGSSFFQDGSLTGNNESLVTDWVYRENTAQDVFAHAHIFLVYIGFKAEEVLRF